MSTSLGPEVGRELLDDLGFLLVPGPPLEVGRSYLFVAVRPTPTLRHFDPERVDYWVTREGHGVPASIDWPSREPLTGDHSWGQIRVVDRLGAANEFLSFGGELIVTRLADIKICVFSSDAPIVACGGHSQDWAAGARDMYGYLGRLRAVADPRDTLEAQIGALSPAARYAAFVADALKRARRSEEHVGWPSGSRPVLERERARLQAESAADWAAGVGLLGKVLE
jgi:hypothetical protein